MFSLDNYNEALNILKECEDIMEKTEELFKRVPEDLKAAFYQIVYYPAMAVPNVLRIQIYAALNNKYANLGLLIANEYANKCREAIDLDNKLFYEYNDNMPGTIEHGTKWSGMISCGQDYHIGLQKWDRDSGVLPSLKYVEPNTNEVGMNVLVEGITNSFNKVINNEEVFLPAFNEINKETYEIKLCSKGNKFTFSINTKEDWIYLSESRDGDTLKMYSLSGIVVEKQSVFVRINWKKIKNDSIGTLYITSGEQVIKVIVEAKMTNLSGIESKTYIMVNDYATIDVSNYNLLVDGKGINNQGNEVENKLFIIPDNGKYRSALRTTSSTITYENVEDLKNAPYAEYKVLVSSDGVYNLQSQFNPTSNLVYGQVRLRYGISIDGGDIEIINTINEDYLAGTWRQGTWALDIENNSRKSEKTNITLTKGLHTIRYYQCDPNIALIRMILYSGKLANVYGAPEESPLI
jgi:translation elongation factor P/translation initiation factor 5A